MGAVTSYLIPVYVLGALVLLLGVLFVLSRIQGGRYLRPLMQFLLRVPYVGSGLKKLSEKALERSNPDLASAVKKLERLGAHRDPQRAQQALSQLSPAERRAFLAAAGEQQQLPTPANRQQRRQLARKGQRRKG
jgi:hypothetical protein